MIPRSGLIWTCILEVNTPEPGTCRRVLYIAWPYRHSVISYSGSSDLAVTVFHTASSPVIHGSLRVYFGHGRFLEKGGSAKLHYLSSQDHSQACTIGARAQPTSRLAAASSHTKQNLTSRYRSIHGFKIAQASRPPVAKMKINTTASSFRESRSMVE